LARSHESKFRPLRGLVETKSATIRRKKFPYFSKTMKKNSQLCYWMEQNSYTNHDQLLAFQSHETHIFANDVVAAVADAAKIIGGGCADNAFGGDKVVLSRRVQQQQQQQQQPR
jgi:hypothetical protein